MDMVRLTVTYTATMGGIEVELAKHDIDRRASVVKAHPAKHVHQLARGCPLSAVTMALTSAMSSERERQKTNDHASTEPAMVAHASPDRGEEIAQ